MHLCLIAPTPLLQALVKYDDMHLVLTSQVLKDQEYAEFYRQRLKDGQHVILDNDAYEKGVPASLEDMQRADDLLGGASEIVAPDVLGDREATQVAVEKALPILLRTGRPIMFVPQGETLAEWTSCCYWMYRNLMTSRSVLGIPRYIADRYGSLLPVLGFIQGMVEALQEIAPGKVHPPVHLLGAPKFRWAIREAVRFFPTLVRSTDTAKPVIAGLNGLLWQNIVTPVFPFRRPENYFETDARGDDFLRVLNNVHAARKELAHATEYLRKVLLHPERAACPQPNDLDPDAREEDRRLRRSSWASGDYAWKALRGTFRTAPDGFPEQDSGSEGGSPDQCLPPRGGTDKASGESDPF